MYGAFSACLLTDSGGVAGGSAKAAWSGMEQASLVTHAKVSYLAVAGAATAGDAAPYLASLASVAVRRCNLIMAAGVAQASVANADARRFGSVRFVVIGARATRSNVAAVMRSIRAWSPGRTRSSAISSCNSVRLQKITRIGANSDVRELRSDSWRRQ